MILALTSKTTTPGQIYEAVSNIVSQRLAQVEGVGDVEIGGGSLPAVRVELLPFALHRYGISTEDVRAAIQASNANRPKGALEGDDRRCRSTRRRPARRAADYRGMVVAWRNGAAVRLGDVAEVIDGVENTRTLGLFNGEPAVIVLITRQPGANVIETVDGVRACCPSCRRSCRPTIELQVASDRTNSIRASLREIELTLLISIVLVVLVVGVFLRSVRATLIPAVATVVSLLGTFGVMYLLGFCLNNLTPDGADGRDRLRRRRRDRRAREHEPPHRGRHGPHRRPRCSARARSASRCCRSASRWSPCSSRCSSWAAGRAAVPRVRGDAVGRR